MKSEWLKKYPVFAMVQGSKHEVRCTSCCCNINVRTGSILQLEKHVKTKKHLKHVSEQKNQTQLTAFCDAKAEQKVYRAELQYVYYLAEHDEAFLNSDHFTPLVKAMFPDSKIARNYKCSRTKCTILAKTVIAPEIQKQVVAELIRSQNYSILIDETTDRSTIKQLAIVVKYMHEDSGYTLSTKMLDMVPCNEATGENLFNCVMECLAKYKLDPHKIVGMGSDSAANIVGVRNSCYSRFKSLNPHLYLSKCVCHIAATCSSKAAEAIPDEVEELVQGLWAYFSVSSVRQQNLNLFNEFLSCEPLKLLKPSQTRWLSLESCINRVLGQWDRLEPFFNSVSDSAGRKIQKKMTPVNKLYLLFLQGTLPLMNNFNRMFQVPSS